MTETHQGTYGAKVQSWRRANPRELLRRLLDENPNDDKAALFEIFWSEISEEASTDLLKSVAEYWFANNYHSLTGHAAVRPLARKSEIKALIEKRIIEEARVMLLDMMMPNGKYLAQCTKEECTVFGGWLKAVASKLTPNQEVGAVLSEDELRAIYSEAWAAR